MRILEQFVGEERDCSYLPGETAALEYRLMVEVSPDQWEEMLARGWRRFGVAYFRPRCPACAECVPLRVPVEHFRLSRSQRRVWNKGRGIEMTLGPPTVDQARLDLYRDWHAMQEGRRGWTHDAISAERYFHEFAFPHPSVREVAYRDGDRLVAVAIVDETPDALSAVYTYHDPEYANLSLGTLSILRQIALARRVKKRWLYLGYRVLGCKSSEYKGRFFAHELLDGYPGAQEAPRWVRVDRKTG